jgi:hypothetical protein
MKKENLYLCFKIISMKRKLLYAFGFVVITLSFSSCDKTCKVCQQNTYDSNNVLLTSGDEKEYCGTELVGVEATQPYTILGVTTKWVCR